jgi:hypothetical protein
VKIKLIPVSLGLKFIPGCVTLELVVVVVVVVVEWASCSLIVVKRLTETFVLKLFGICK